MEKRRKEEKRRSRRKGEEEEEEEEEKEEKEESFILVSSECQLISRICEAMYLSTSSFFGCPTLFCKKLSDPGNGRDPSFLAHIHSFSLLILDALMSIID